MFIPPAFAANSIFDDQKLNEELHCLCGNKVKIKDHIALWTTTPQDKVPGWYVACHGQCIVAKIVEGRC